MNTGIVTVSGVHGVGKSTVCKYLQRSFNLGPEIERPSNPFKDSYHSMLFFVASFSARDSKVKEQALPMAVDRYSFHDIAVYIEVLKKLDKITREDYWRLRSINITALLHSLEPEIAILLDDDVESLLLRLQNRGGKTGHIFEYDPEVLYHLNEAFIREFATWEITRAWFNAMDIPRPPVLRVSVRNRTASEIGLEVLARLRNIGLPSSWVLGECTVKEV